MGLINETENKNDPRLQGGQVPPAPILTPPPVQQQDIPEPPPDAPQDVAPISPLDIQTPQIQQDGEIQHENLPLDAINPPLINPNVPGIPEGTGSLGIAPSQEGGGFAVDPSIPQGFGTQVPVEIQAKQQQELELLKQAQQIPYEDSYLSGETTPTVYNTPDSYKQQLDRETEQWFKRAAPQVPQAEDNLRQSLQRPGIPGMPWVDGRFNPDPLRNPFGSVYSTNQVKNFWEEGLTGLEAEAKKNNFDPWAGYKQLWGEFKKDPWGNAWKLPLWLPLGSAAGKYGDFGEGYLGSVLYTLGIGQNAVQAGATSLYNIATGNYQKEANRPSFVQGLLGKSYDFTTESSPDRPLSFLGSKSNPDTFDQLADRSILWKSPFAYFGIQAAKLAFGKKIPEPIKKGFTDQWGNSYFRYPEFTAGLIADLATPEPRDIVKLFRPSYWKTFGQATKPVKETSEKVIGLENFRPTTLREEVPKLAVIPKTPDQIVKTILNAEPVVPGELVQVIRSNEDLTNLAVRNGDILPQPGALTKRRLDLLAQENPTYNRLGAPIIHMEATLEPHQKLLPPGNDLIEAARELTTEQAALKFQEIRKRLMVATPEEVQKLAQDGDAIATAMTMPPKVSNPFKLAEVQGDYPRNLITKSPDGIQATQELVDIEHAYFEASETASEIMDDLQMQKQALANFFDDMDNQSLNVGRQNLDADEVIPFNPSEEIISVNTKTELASNLSQQTFYHGSKVTDLDLAKIDPLVGGSRGEFGTAIYFTNKADDALDYAKAHPGRNLPDVTGRKFSEVGNVHEAKIDFTNPINSTKAVDELLKASIIDAVNSSALDQSIKKSISRWISRNDVTLQELYPKVDEAIAGSYSGYPENVGLDVQRRINDTLRKNGYDAIVHSVNGDTQVAYLGKPGGGNPITTNAVTQHGVGDLLEQAISRYMADTKIAKRYPNNVYSKATSVDSQGGLLYRYASQTQDNFDIAQEKATRLANDLVQAEDKLTAIAKAESEVDVSRRVAKAGKADDLTIQHTKSPDTNPCL